MSSAFPYQTPIPRSHIIASGDYSVMLTAAGSGFSQWKGCAITRWREDVTCDGWGSYVFLRDIDSGAAWSAGFQPLAAPPDEYSLSFDEGAARIERRDGDIVTTLDVIVDQGDTELRRITLSNRGDQNREIELTTYSELVLASATSDAAHPAFSKIFVQTEFDVDQRVLLASRRPRTPDEQRICVAQWLQFAGDTAETDGELEFETDRLRFIGRGGSLRSSAALTDHDRLSGTLGTVLDPIFSLRRRVNVRAGASVSVLLVTAVAETRDALMGVVKKRRSTPDFDRLLDAAKQRGQEALGQAGVDAVQAQRFQRMANALYYSDSSLRAPADQIVAGNGGSPTLWAGAISGDNPIVLVNVSDTGGLTLVDDALKAQAYWLDKGLTADVVMVGSGDGALQAALKERVGDGLAVQTTDSKPHRFALATDSVSNELRDGLRSVARIVLDQSRGSLGDQISALPINPKYALPSVTHHQASIGKLASVESPSVVSAQIESRSLENALEHYNGYGGFDRDGREYVSISRDGVRPPMPWRKTLISLTAMA